MSEFTGEKPKSPNADIWNMENAPKLETSSNPEAEKNIAETGEDKEAIVAARENVLASFPDKEFSKSTTEVVPSVSSSLVQEAPKPHPVLQTIKRAATATGGVTLIGAATVAATLAPASIPLAIPAAIIAADAVVHSIRGVNGSKFQVNRKNRITQRLNPLSVLFKHRGQKPAEIFEEETKKLFGGLKPGETYNTHSQAMTYAFLRRAQKQGLITDLTAEKNGTSRLILENLVTGNWKALRSGKKHDMYDVSFKMV